jgi:hypothetical protein
MQQGSGFFCVALFEAHHVRLRQGGCATGILIILTILAMLAYLYLYYCRIGLLC